MEVIEVNFRKVKRRPRISDESRMGVLRSHTVKITLPDYPSEIEFKTEDRVFRTKEIAVEREPGKYHFFGNNEIPKAEELPNDVKDMFLDLLGVAVRDQKGKVESPKGEDAV